MMKTNNSKQSTPAPGENAAAKKIRKLITDLNSQDGLVRVKARKSLVEIGGPAVPMLVKALSNKKQWVRWEAAKTLGQIGDSRATTALIKALDDKLFDVRWLAAEGLDSIGHEAIIPLLQALEKHPDSLWLREGVHHVLHNLEGGHLNKILDPVLTALEGFEPSVEAPLAAGKALEALKESGSKQK
jgi:HEAT repeat protein